MKFSYLLAMAATAMATSKGVLTRDIFQNFALTRRDAVTDISDVIKTLNDTMQAQIYLIRMFLSTLAMFIDQFRGLILLY
jgi:hypothetical protein